MDFQSWVTSPITFSPEHRVELFFKSGGAGYFRTPYWGHFKDIVATVGKWRERTKVWEVDKLGIVYVLQNLRVRSMLDRERIVGSGTKDSFWLPDAELAGTLVWMRRYEHTRFSSAVESLFAPRRFELVKVEFMGYGGLVSELQTYFDQVTVNFSAMFRSAVSLVTDVPADELYEFVEFLAGYNVASEIDLPLGFMNGNVAASFASIPVILPEEVSENNGRRDSGVRRLR